MRTTTIQSFLIGTVMAVTACGEADFDDGGYYCDPEFEDCGFSEARSPRPDSQDEANNSAPAAEPDSSPDFIPETEERPNFQAPQSSQNYVFVANTGLDTVAKIDGDTLEITSIEVGDEPTVVRTWKEKNVAVALNSGSSDVSIIHASPQRDIVVSLPIRSGFNQIIMAPGGDHALAYLDYRSAEAQDSVGRFQDVNLIRLVEGEEAVFNIAVGFRVLEIEFDEDGQRAFVVTEDGISIVEMAGVDQDISAQPLRVTDDPLEDAEAVDREVEITRDGQMAIVRSSVLEGVNLIPLTQDGQRQQIPLPGVPTDLDIYPDSQLALAVVKGARQVALIDLNQAPEDGDASAELIDVPEGPLGLAALDIASNTALLYSPAGAEPRITKLDLGTGATTVWDVRKAIRGVSLSPDASRAVIFHVKGDTPRTQNEADAFIAKSWAYTVLDVESGFSKLTTAATEPGEFVFSPDGLTMFVVLSQKDQNIRQVDKINLTSFRVDSIALGSPPEHIGILPSSGAPRVYVSQEHPSGRMTFIDIDDGSAKTVTGYELNSRIE